MVSQGLSRVFAHSGTCTMVAPTPSCISAMSALPSFHAPQTMQHSLTTVHNSGHNTHASHNTWASKKTAPLPAKAAAASSQHPDIDQLNASASATRRHFKNQTTNVLFQCHVTPYAGMSCHCTGCHATSRHNIHNAQSVNKQGFSEHCQVLSCAAEHLHIHAICLCLSSVAVKTVERLSETRRHCHLLL